MNENPDNNQNLGENSLNSTSLGGINLGNVTPNNNYGTSNQINNATLNQNAGISSNNLGNGIPSELANNNGYEAVKPVSNTPNSMFDNSANNDLELLSDVPNINPIPVNNEEVLTKEHNTTSEPVPQPIPLSDSTQINPMMSNANAYINSKPQDIGAVPPANNNKGSKKASNKIVFIILIVILMAGVAFGVYYFLNITNKNVTLTPKTISVGIGEKISTKVSDFVTVKKGDISLCSVSHNADSSKVGEYIYTVTCGEKQKFSGKIIVSDKQAPIVEVNAVFKTVGDTVSVDEFIYNCTDPSDCSKKFVNASDVNQNVTKAQNTPYTVDIEVTDSAGNSKVVNGTLYVVDKKIIAYTSFEAPEEQVSNVQATRKIIDIFPITSDGSIEALGVSRRNYTYVFANKEEYLNAIGNKDTIISFDGKTGNAIYDDENLKLIISTDLSKTTLDKEINGTFPTLFTELQKYYDSKGYKFSNSQSYMQKK